VALAILADLLDPEYPGVQFARITRLASVNAFLSSATLLPQNRAWQSGGCWP
jgi:hypothetical protein